ncbi:MAG: right-handed parallel beta-helix repeat-containing protein [Clostridia bacterium]|nr:right-handed parallel beta-helix repeat-containing protein [Clostridia bacterium]
MKRIMSCFLLAVFVLSAFGLWSCGAPDAGPDDNKNTGDPAGDREKEPAGKSFYVSPEGDDSNDGSEQSPLATLDGARAAVLAYKTENGLPDGGVEVVFLPGVYRVDSQTVFTPEDSGEEGKPIAYRAKEAGSVFFDGGVSIDPSLFVPASEEVKAKLPDDAAKENVLEADLKAAGCYDLDDDKTYSGGWDCFSYRQELYVDNERQTVARWPNSGYEITKLYVFEGEDPYLTVPEGKAEKWAAEKTRYYGYPEIDWDAINLSDDAISIDVEKSSLVFDGRKYKKTDRSKYYVYNLLCELDAPGEYYWDVGKGKLYYYPDGDLKERKISFSQFAEDWIMINDASYLSFEGITFENGRATVISGKTQKTNDTNHITVDGCVFRDLGGYAVDLVGAFITVKNCEIYNLGSGCVFLNGGRAKDQYSNCSVVSNNIIHDWSQTYTVYGAAVTAYGVGYTISHNEMFNSPHEAVAFNCSSSLIEYNYIHDVCNQTSDAGAVYSGRRWDWWGNVIRFNLIENVIDTTFGGGPCAIYLDDMLSGQWCYGNILVNIAGTGFSIGGGKKNTIENNIMINVGDTPITYDQRAVGNDFGHGAIEYPKGSMWGYLTGEVKYLSDYQRFAVPQNLLMIEHTGYSSRYCIDDPGTPSYGIVRDNITYLSDHLLEEIISPDEIEDIYKDAVTLDGVTHPSGPARVYGTFESNIRYGKDPGFADLKNGNYALKEDSRVYRDIPGFIKIDTDSIGIQK